jgi:bifunctional DNA-binding transcriptional regulator/antitoxin component of YhaV-PrlF toxin-antitoxin module
MVAEPITDPQADDRRRRYLPHHVGETTITGKNQIHLPAEGLRELSWERGDRLMVQIVQGNMLVLMRHPTQWADAFAGKLGEVFGDHEDTIVYLNEERQSWGDE